MRDVDIFGAIYEVVERHPEIVHEDGECDPIKHEIKLKNTIRDSEALLHEVGHGILFEGGLYCALDEKLREVIVQQFAQVISKNFFIRFKDR